MDYEVPANETTSESVKELCHGCREGSRPSIMDSVKVDY